MTLDEIRALLRNVEASTPFMEAVANLGGTLNPFASWMAMETAFVAYCDERARNLAQVIAAEQEALRDAVAELCEEAEEAVRLAEAEQYPSFAKDLSAAIARVRALLK